MASSFIDSLDTTYHLLRDGFSLNRTNRMLGPFPIVTYENYEGVKREYIHVPLKYRGNIVGKNGPEHIFGQPRMAQIYSPNTLVFENGPAVFMLIMLPENEAYSFDQSCDHLINPLQNSLQRLTFLKNMGNFGITNQPSDLPYYQIMKDLVRECENKKTSPAFPREEIVVEKKYIENNLTGAYDYKPPTKRFDPEPMLKYDVGLSSSQLIPEPAHGISPPSARQFDYILDEVDASDKLRKFLLKSYPINLSGPIYGELNPEELDKILLKSCQIGGNKNRKELPSKLFDP